MEISKLPEIRDYWYTDPYLHCDPVASRITRDWFEQISCYLHFVNNEVFERGVSRGVNDSRKLCQ